jgi:hypothetical protein
MKGLGGTFNEKASIAVLKAAQGVYAVRGPPEDVRDRLAPKSRPAGPWAQPQDNSAGIVWEHGNG